MHKYIYLTLLIFSIVNLQADSFSVMSFNVENLFDTQDDFKKDDKAFLPLSKKQLNKHKQSCKRIRVQVWKNECLYLDWNETVKDAKLINILNLIIAYEDSGPDVIVFQEIENNNVLQQLFNLLEPYGYSDYKLLEGNDYRGIDNAVISKYPIKDSRLHYIKFSGEFSNKDSRPILDVLIDINGTNVRFYGVHFPAPYLNFQMRESAFIALNQLLIDNKEPSVALGDFNVIRTEAKSRNTFYNQEIFWEISHHVGCNSCKGTYYYAPNNDWSFLDAILVSKGRNISFMPESIKLHTTSINMDKDNIKPVGFDVDTLEGVSDHIPLVAKINF
jgi:endonuclease/exonuclease/phosphatase family metal-dependent hydrolase|tara:strand:- start:11228 stop:12220 length:993 start_codon:yes stop_codon:yes gene_type:complete